MSQAQSPMGESVAEIFLCQPNNKWVRFSHNDRLKTALLRLSNIIHMLRAVAHYSRTSVARTDGSFMTAISNSFSSP